MYINMYHLRCDLLFPTLRPLQSFQLLQLYQLIPIRRLIRRSIFLLIVSNFILIPLYRANAFPKSVGASREIAVSEKNHVLQRPDSLEMQTVSEFGGR